MADKPETLMEKLVDKIHPHGDSSSSDSENEVPKSSGPSVKSQVHRLFGRERPVHQILGGGKQADMFLWRDKKASAAAFTSATAIWVLFQLMEYHLLTLVCHSLILTLAALFLYSNATTFFNKSPPQIPFVSIPEDLAVNIVLSLRFEINRTLTALKEIALGRDLKKFLAVIAGLWAISFIGSCCNFITLFYIVFVLLHTVPLVYEKYDDKIDSFGEKAMEEIKKQYAIFDAKLLSKIPRGPLKDKKH